MTPPGKQHYSPTPLDFLILGKLPMKGILGGVHWAGRPLKHVRDDINQALPEGAPPVAMSTIQARSRSMKTVGYLEDFASHGSGRIWAKTAAGVAFEATKDQVLGA